MKPSGEKSDGSMNGDSPVEPPRLVPCAFDGMFEGGPDGQVQFRPRTP